MDERSVAHDLVRAAGVAALDEGGPVQSLRVRAGGLSGIDPVALRNEMVWWSRGTVVEGAALEVEVGPADTADRHSGEVTLVSLDLG